MATARSQIPPTNLKERIAALEQRNSVANSSRPTSPTPSIVSANGAVAPGFRDKIAKFERKGGVPVPRGSFGLGAPPTIEGPRKRGELYGNRIPAPARAFSSGMLPDPSRASVAFTDMQSVGSPEASPTYVVGDRRSFSLSSVMSDEVRDYSPVSSPTFEFPPDSPEYGSSRFTAETGDIPPFSKPIVRGTSFQKALEIAKNAEVAKAENTDAAALSDNTDSSPPGGEMVPTIIISSDGTAPTTLGEPVHSAVNRTHMAEPGLEVKVDRHVLEVNQKEAESEVILPVYPLAIRKHIPSPVHDSEAVPNLVAMTLDSKLLEEGSVDPPLDTGNTSALSLTDVLGDFFTKNADGTVRPATPTSKSVVSPTSPMATLAYDSPETPEKEKQGKPATITVPDSQDFLSPPPTTAARASMPSSGGSSLGSLSSLGSRPMSMIEAASFTQVSRAMRMTPATGRGVPMFFPPSSAMTRKSDFVYFPPTPTEEEEFGEATGSATHKARQSLDSRQWASENSAAEPSLERATTFTAVVHSKIREPPKSAPVSKFSSVSVPRPPPPATPQVKRAKSATIEPPLSPGSGELAALLQEAVMLEDSLDRGELPTETMDAKEAQMKEDEVVATAEAKKKNDEERQRIAAAAVRLQAKRDEPTSGRLKHTFLVPLSKARSAHRKEVSAPEPSVKQQEDPVSHPKSAGVPEVLTALPSAKHHVSQNGQGQRPATPESDNRTVHQQHLETPPKSAKTSRFAGFRRLGSISARPNTIHGHSTRTSVSTMSSDSTTVVTPSDGTTEFSTSRQPSVNEFGGLSANGSTTSFPSLSPKKSSTSIGRAASFAERVFSRTRTKSNGSVLSSTSEMTDRIPEDAPSLPTISIGPFTSSNLEPIPSTPSIILPVSDTEVKVFQPPKRSTSLARSSRLPPLPAEFVPPLPVITPSAFFSTTAEASNTPGASFLSPTTGDETRPTSWTSMSSAGSLPSPLFDTALFDAFPSVPENTPALPATTTSAYYAPQRVKGQTISYERPSFDSDLLSSAIHLANTHKSTAPIVGPSPPSAHTPAPRRSGESAR